MTRSWTDGHLDLAWLALEGRDLERARTHDEGGVSLPGLREAGVDLIFATIFTAPGETDTSGYATDDEAHLAGMKQLDVYAALARSGAMRIVLSREDLPRAKETPAHFGAHGAAESRTAPVTAVLLMENADPIRTPEEVQRWFDLGIRIIGMAWAPGSRYAGGNDTARGLSSEGRRFVQACDEIGIIHDASHLSDAAFADLLEISRGPVIASHSNCRAITGPRQRHVSDTQIAAIASRGGVIGINLFGRFLVPDSQQPRGANITDCLRHIAHIESVTGTRRTIALGSDMDGGFPPSSLPDEIRRPADYARLADALARIGWSDEDINGFAGENWHRFLREHLPAAA